MPKTAIPRRGKVETGMTSYGSMGVAGETDVTGVRGKGKSGKASARTVVGDSGKKKHEASVKKESESMKDKKMGSSSTVTTSPKGSSFKTTFDRT